MTASGDLVRGLVPRLVLPLAVASNCLAAALWLRSFPLSVMGVPLFGAAVLSVVLAAVFVRQTGTSGQRLWLTALLDVIAFVAFTLLIVLRDPTGFADLATGLYSGPSQVLTFAVPLVSPRTLMVAPVALVWLAGAVGGEYAARQWSSALPYGGFLLSFGLSYAATVRAVDGVAPGSFATRETLVAGGLLVALLLMRAAQSWARQDRDAETTQPDGVLPLRGLAAGAFSAFLVAGLAGAVVQSDTFGTKPATPQRVPSIDSSAPVNPVSFVAGLRPANPQARGTDLFTVTTSGTTPGYFSLANVDRYDGSGWSFSRTFRPSGGVLPGDVDPGLAAESLGLSQDYRIDKGALVGTSWLPYVSRPQRVTGIGINADPDSGMIIPTRPLAAGESYTMRSTVPVRTFADLKSDATPDSLTATENVQLPPGLALTLTSVIEALSRETQVSTDDPMAFLHAIQRNFQDHYSLPGQPVTAAPSGGPATPTTSPVPSAATSPVPSAARTAAGQLAGSTNFADVAASILRARTGTPEQFATLTALIARQLNVPARIATGFRVHPELGRLPAGTYHVSTAEAWTWVTVPVTGAGWVVLDAAPTRYGNNAPEQSQGATTSPSPLPTRTPSDAVISQGSGGHGVAPESQVPDQPPADRSAVLRGVLIAVVALAGVLVLLLLLRKPVRAWRRRRRPDPRDRLLGAWQECIDVLSEAGLPPLDALTNAEIAALAAERFGPEPGFRAADLGRQANAVVYSERTTIGDGQAAEAWRTQRSVRRMVRRGLGPRDRVAATLRYHRVRHRKPAWSPTSWADIAPVPSRRDRRRSREYVGRRRKH
jgi:hypothetical protein